MKVLLEAMYLCYGYDFREYYFSKSLQDRVHKLIYESLCPSGILGIGDKETTRFSPFASSHESLCENERIYNEVC